MRSESVIDLWNDVLCFDLRDCIFAALRPCPLAQRALALTCTTSYEEGKRYNTHKSSLLDATEGREWEKAYRNFMEAGHEYWPIARPIADWYNYFSDIPYIFGDAVQIKFVSRVDGPLRYINHWSTRLLLRNGHGKILEDFLSSDHHRRRLPPSALILSTNALQEALVSGDALTIDIARRCLADTDQSLFSEERTQAILSGSATSLRAFASSSTDVYSSYHVTNLLPLLSFDTRLRGRVTETVKILHKEYDVDMKQLAAPLLNTGLLDAFQYVMASLSGDRDACRYVIRNIAHGLPYPRLHSDPVDYKCTIALLDTIAAYGADMLTDPVLDDAYYCRDSDTFSYPVCLRPPANFIGVTLRSGAVLYLPEDNVAHAILRDSSWEESVERVKTWEKAGLSIDLQLLAAYTGSAALVRVMVALNGLPVTKRVFLECLLGLHKWEGNTVADLAFARDHADDELKESLSTQFEEEVDGQLLFEYQRVTSIVSRELYDFYKECFGGAMKRWHTEYRLINMLELDLSEAAIEEFSTGRVLEWHPDAKPLDMKYLRLSKRNGYVPYVRYVLRTLKDVYKMPAANEIRAVITYIGKFDLVDKLIALRPNLGENPFADDRLMDELADKGALKCIMYVIKEGLWFPTTIEAYAKIACRCTFAFKYLLLNHKERLDSLEILQKDEINADIVSRILSLMKEIPGGVHALSFLAKQKLWPSIDRLHKYHDFAPALVHEFVLNGYLVTSELGAEEEGTKNKYVRVTTYAERRYMRYLEARAQGDGWALH